MQKVTIIINGATTTNPDPTKYAIKTVLICVFPFTFILGWILAYYFVQDITYVTPLRLRQ